MRDIWYSDNRDVVKWSVLVRLAKQHLCSRILQIAYFRESNLGPIEIDSQTFSVPPEVQAHFRDIRKVGELPGPVKVSVLTDTFANRTTYLEKAIAFIAKYSAENCVVFLDPDTGLAPSNPNLNHVLDSEAQQLWKELKAGDIFVFYQHQTNRSGEPWIEPKRLQLERALRLKTGAIKVAHGPKIARDVAFFYLAKT